MYCSKIFPFHKTFKVLILRLKSWDPFLIVRAITGSGQTHKVIKEHVVLTAVKLVCGQGKERYLLQQTLDAALAKSVDDAFFIIKAQGPTVH